MKKLVYLFSVMLVLTVFNSTNAKAAGTIAQIDNSQSFWQDLWSMLGWGASGSGNTTTSGTTSSSSSNTTSTNTASDTHLPINNGIVFLTIAGMVIGITTIKRNKLTLQPVRA